MAFVPKPVAPRVASPVASTLRARSAQWHRVLHAALLRGFALPMWGVLVVLLGYSVLPIIAFLRRTFGLSVAGSRW